MPLEKLENFPEDPQAETDSGAGMENPATLLAWVSQHANSLCAGCGVSLCGHQLLHSRAAAGPVPPRCLKCLAMSLKVPALQMGQNLTGYVARRDCYRAAWDWLTAAEPNCNYPNLVAQSCAKLGVSVAKPDLNQDPEHAAEWDSGSLGCGDLLLPLRGKMRALNAGQILKLIARDASAPQDIPAWCGVTGHQLILGAHPSYWIRRRND